MSVQRQPNNSKQAQSYLVINRTVLGITACSLALPFLFSMLGPTWPRLFPACLSRSFFGIPCPMCGLTRGLGALVHGNIAEACVYNILTVPVLILLVAEFAYRAFASFVEFPSARLARIIRTDLYIHLILFSLYLLYSIAFLGLVFERQARLAAIGGQDSLVLRSAPYKM